MGLQQEIQHREVPAYQYSILAAISGKYCISGFSCLEFKKLRIPAD
jgi:hypothetical protein